MKTEAAVKSAIMPPPPFQTASRPSENHTANHSFKNNKPAGKKYPCRGTYQSCSPGCAFC
ncbi:hypothetical protein NEIELOOT_00315 [Neisseria elongata subsp. glycolytica ATCC 29315]|uniref:Uncharacterized protein n=1 Tax=Neisseria elongata subsp. glycolytica ATCC 29315 TaxID=546263 RepID=D4DMP1_NEIEG|nr:hypothetical protein NEIELOOT_00315 [Neisseria elongata subsp. glycolytica ATCC 29315]